MTIMLNDPDAISPTGERRRKKHKILDNKNKDAAGAHVKDGSNHDQSVTPQITLLMSIIDEGATL